MRRIPSPARPDPRQPWQIEQAARCGCKGTDEMCACQNEIEGSSVTPARRIRELEGTVATLELQQQTDRQTIASMASALEAAKAELVVHLAQAAAPDLLFALRNLLAVRRGEGGTTYHCDEIAAAAIAKATGEQW